MLNEAALAAPPAKRNADVADGPRVSAVLPTRDRPEFLPSALDSLELQGLKLEILVIDNASAPPAAQAVEAECARRENVRLHRSERNLGAAGGRCRGMELCSGERLLFLDDDAELMPGALAHMLAVLETEPAAGAVSATVVTPDGLISHSGGTFECNGDIARFVLIGNGQPFAETELAPTGPADWLGFTALLVRRDLLEAFPLDESMMAYHADNEWGFRVTRERPGSFLRSREALALHHLAGRQAGERQSVDLPRVVDLLAACARFHARHGILMGPWAWELIPERAAADGTLGLDEIRLLMELITTKGAEWTLQAWSEGELDGLLFANRRRDELVRATVELDTLRPEVARLNAVVAEQHRTASWLHEREATLRRIEGGGWWRLRTRLAPLLNLLSRRPGKTRSRSSQGSSTGV